MQVAVRGLRFVLFVFGVVAVVPALSEGLLAECAPEAEVQKAVRRAERLVSKQLGRSEAGQLLAILKEEETVVNGQVCFSVEDFARFGQIVGEFLESQVFHAARLVDGDEDEDDDWQPLFAGSDDETVSTSQCACVKCPRRYKPWCSGASTGCCPRLCSSIFRTISVGALAGLKGSGIDTCCEEGSIKCKTLRATKKSGKDEDRKEKRSSSGEDDNGESSEDDFDIDEQSLSPPSLSASPSAPPSLPPSAPPSPPPSPSSTEVREERSREEDGWFSMGSAFGDNVAVGEDVASAVTAPSISAASSPSGMDLQPSSIITSPSPWTSMGHAQLHTSTLASAPPSTTPFTSLTPLPSASPQPSASLQPATAE